MNDEVLVRVEGVSKKFCRSLKKSLWYGMQDLGNELRGRRHGGDGELRPDEFWAVKDVSFELRRGECLGLIGRNGAGKTTLLRMLNGLIKPDRGRIEMRGRVGALIALGAGFNPVLTGRENIYVNAAVLGFSKERTDLKIREIIEFSELGEFIDAPVQTLSSGMQVRLGFSIASALQCDILLLDEILAVGDASFRSKCYRKIHQLGGESAVIFVSHNLEQTARICSRAMLMNDGIAVAFDSVADAINEYELNIGSKCNDDEVQEDKIFFPLESINLGQRNYTIKQGATLWLNIGVSSYKIIPCCWVRVVIFNSASTFSADVDIKNSLFDIPNGRSIISVAIEDVRLRSGVYRMGINIFTNGAEILFWAYKSISLAVVDQNHVGNADYQLRASVRIRYD